MSPLSTPRPLRSLFVLAALVLMAIPAAAQEISYATVTRGEFGGSMGAMMAMVPGANEPTRETVFVKGSLMRTDSDGSSTIINAADGIMTMLQHDERTFYSLSMADMAAMGAAMAEGMMGGANAEAWEGQQPQVEPQFDMERTGRTMEINGYEAHEVLMTVEMGSGGGRGMGMGMGTEEEGGGSMVLFTQLWLSTDVPGYDAYQEAQAQMGEQFMNAGGGFAAAFTSDPRMAQAFEENKEVMKEMEGLPLKTISAFVTVPEGVEFDRDAVLASLDEPLEAGEGAMDAGAAAAAAMKSLGGMFGRRGGDEPEEEEGPQVQSIMMRTVSTIEDIRTSGIADDLFTIPEGYTKIDPGIGGDWIG